MALSLWSRFVSRLRFLMVATVGAYAAINLMLALLSPFTAGWPIFGVTALAVPPMVLAMVYGVIPIAFRFGTPR
ncbi:MULTISPECIES: hypothetical protein [Bosea]|jgi:hypothetical protein|uniref:hypothetical protein n=1 Tax=Bosea TaxID=85413 RepID=UPI00214FABE5|nr:MULTISPECIES: hypothetical protein [Bosea]MCR4522805.1 hypothetical protein [Bosea sp. 47.2.35]MDR6826576.1 hypothetical protein [Bosea robiniae]MDR6893286.1 hypothetical protein [Bosea sp. BE109]MDR7137015.1 hypothetical protein [Bosea sp. BE168]MDR7173714.1 hypothetical protein [Bosea sp. BE271]